MNTENEYWVNHAKMLYYSHKASLINHQGTLGSRARCSTLRLRAKPIVLVPRALAGRKQLSRLLWDTYLAKVSTLSTGHGRGPMWILQDAVRL